MNSFMSRALLLALILSILSACDGPIDLVDPYDRIQGEPSGQVSTALDVPAGEPEPTYIGLESGGAGAESTGEESTGEAAGEAEGGR